MHTHSTDASNKHPTGPLAMSASKDMYTRCPHCHTYFKIQSEQIRQAQGKVRCGRCYKVFNAIGNLLEQLPEPVKRPRRGKRAYREVPAEPASPGKTQTRPGETAIVGDTPPAPTAERIEGIAAGPSDARELVLHPALEMEVSEPRPVLRQLGWAVGVAALVLVFALQYVHFNRGELTRSDTLRPLAKLVCAITGCRLPLQTDIDSLELSHRDITSHPKTEGALLISAVIANNADFDQPFPAMEVRLSDTGGRLVASRLFYPQEYLDPDINLRHGLGSDRPVQIALEIADPGKNAVNFQFRFSRVPGMR